MKIFVADIDGAFLGQRKHQTAAEIADEIIWLRIRDGNGFVCQQQARADSRVWFQTIFWKENELPGSFKQSGIQAIPLLL